MEHNTGGVMTKLVVGSNTQMCPSVEETGVSYYLISCMKHILQKLDAKHINLINHACVLPLWGPPHSNTRCTSQDLKHNVLLRRLDARGLN